MKIRKSHASLAFRLWILVTVLIIFFLEGFELVGWLALGGILALAWKVLPEEPEAPPERLPFQDEYEGREIPKPGSPEPQDK